MSHKITRRSAIKILGTTAFAAAAPMVISQRAMSASGRIRMGGSQRPIPQTYSRATGGYEKAFPDGTEVEYVAVAGGAQIIAGLAGNSIDISLVGSPPMVTGFAADLDISLIYIQETTLDSEGLVVRNASGITDVKGLVGKKIGVYFNTSAHFGLLNALDINGLSSRDVTLYNVKTDAMTALWQRGEVDAVYTWAPHMDRFINDGGTAIFKDRDLVPHGVLAYDAIVVRNDFKREHPELVLAYLTEFNRVVQIYRNDPESVVQPLADYTQIKIDDVRKFVLSQELVTPEEVISKTWLGRTGEMDAGIYSSLKTRGEFMKQIGQLTSAPDDYAPFVDPSFAMKLAGV